MEFEVEWARKLYGSRLKSLEELFGVKKPIIGMIHLPPLYPLSDYPLDKVIEFALSEAEKLVNAEFSAIMIENFMDNPFPKERVSDYVFSKLSIIVSEIKKQVPIPIGVNILRNACLQALALATVLNLSFIRCNVFEGVYVTDQGLIEGAAFELINLKRQLKSSVKILADVHVKHSRPLGDFTLREAATNAIKRGKADAIIVSGKATGKPPTLEQLKQLKDINIRPILGSGLTVNNLSDFSTYISGAIVGTSIKINSDVYNPIDDNKAIAISKAWKKVMI